MIAWAVIALVVGIVWAVRRYRRNRAPRATVTLDRLGPERPLFIRLPTRRNMRRRRYRG